jgi:hypothetical protein
MPPKRKADATTPWREVSPYLDDMDHFDLMVLLNKAWDSGKDMRTFISESLGDAWTVAAGMAGGEMSDMLKIDWELSNDAKEYIKPKVINFKSMKAKDKVTLPQGWSFTKEELRNMENEDGSALECVDDEYPHEHGCEECGAPGSNIRLVLEKQRSGKQRLRVKAEVFCSCMSRYGEPVCADWTEAIYYPKGQNVGAKMSDRGKAAKRK